VASAVYGILCFALIEVAVLFILPLQVDFNQTIAFGTICAATVISYFSLVQYMQTFSKDEQTKFLRTYIFNGKQAVSVTSLTVSAEPNSSSFHHPCNSKSAPAPRASEEARRGEHRSSQERKHVGRRQQPPEQPQRGQRRLARGQQRPVSRCQHGDENKDNEQCDGY
jgi:hypothetical protein